MASKISSLGLRDLLGTIGYDIPYRVIQAWNEDVKSEVARWAYDHIRLAHNPRLIPPKPPIMKDFIKVSYASPVALFLLLLIVSGCNFTEREICYRGFTYVIFNNSVAPVFNTYGMPLRCKHDQPK